jgi:hypothetical protein
MTRSPGLRTASGTDQAARPRLRAALLLCAAGVAAGVLGPFGGCASMRVRPWDRDLLAEKKMAYVPSPMESAIDEHIYFSTEGSTGGQDIGGGGCGCN